MSIRTIDLFCGAGGSSWGAQAAGAEIVCGVDAWPLAARTYAANFPGARAVTTRLDESSGPDLLDGVGKIDLILASPECTHHTCARGGRPRDEISRSSARYVLKFARELKPRWLIIENVVQMRRWQGYLEFVRELEVLGYMVRPQTIDAADFGVPQSRRRLFLLCDREALPVSVLPQVSMTRVAQRDVVIWGGPWRSKPLRGPRRAAATLARAERAIEALGEGRPFLIVYYGSDGAGGWQPLDRPIRTVTTLDRFGLVTWDGNIPMLRMLQVPELQRAMGLDEQFILPHGTRREHIMLLGNGVCPPVMKSIVQSLTHGSVAQIAAE